MKENGYRIRNQYHPHFITFTVVGWVDLFARKKCRGIHIENLKYCIRHKGMLLYGYVIMCNHVHAIMGAKEDTNGLSGLIRDYKRFTSKQLIHWVLSKKKERRRDWMIAIFRHGAFESGNLDLFQIWMHHNCPMVITQNKFFNQKFNYIHPNPVKAGIVRNPEEYIYSSATNYAGFDENILNVIIIDDWSVIGLVG